MAELSPATLLFKWFGKREWHSIAVKYNLITTDYVGEVTNKMWTVFTEVARELEN